MVRRGSRCARLSVSALRLGLFGNLVLELVLTSAHLTAPTRTEAGPRPRFSPQFGPFLTELQNRRNRCSPPAGRFDSYAAPLKNRLHVALSRQMHCLGRQQNVNLVLDLVPVSARPSASHRISGPKVEPKPPVAKTGEPAGPRGSVATAAPLRTDRAPTSLQAKGCVYAACRDGADAAYSRAISSLFAPSSRIRRQTARKASASWSRAKTFTAIGPSGIEGVASRS